LICPWGGVSNSRRVWGLSKFDENVFRNLLLALKVWCPPNRGLAVILELEKVGGRGLGPERGPGPLQVWWEFNLELAACYDIVPN
jgi:hypothetical protein